MWLWSLGAAAHDPPRATEISWSVDGRAMVVTNRGLILGEPPNGESRLLCFETLGLSLARPPLGTWTSSGDLIVGGEVGLSRSTDDGCSFEPVDPLGTTPITALAADAHGGDLVYVAAFDPVRGGIHRSDDGGASFNQVLRLDGDDYVYSLRYAPSNSDVVYATGWQFGTADLGLRYLRRSLDGGASWEQIELPVSQEEEHAEILALHPTDPSELALRTIALDPSQTHERVLLSRDGGDTFDAVFDAESVRGGGYGADGVLWIAARPGLYRSDAERTSFTSVAATEEMTCAVEMGDSMLACGRYQGIAAGHDGVGRLDATGEHFVPWMDFAEIAGPLDCPPTSSTALGCAAPWNDWTREVSTWTTAGTLDAGLADAAVPDPARPDAGAGASDAGLATQPPYVAPPEPGPMAPVEPEPSSGCGCRVGGTRTAPLALAMLPGLALMLALSRRRRRRS